MAARATHSGWRRATSALAAVAVAVAIPVASAYARPVPAKVRAAAQAVVAKVGRQTHATATKVLGCRRSTSSRYLCQAQNSFRSGADRCVANVTVTLGTRDGRARAKITSYVCY